MSEGTFSRGPINIFAEDTDLCHGMFKIYSKSVSLLWEGKLCSFDLKLLKTILGWRATSLIYFLRPFNKVSTSAINDLRTSTYLLSVCGQCTYFTN